VAKSKPTKMLAVLGRCRRTGRWRIAGRSSVLALLGSCNLDMRHSFVDEEQERLRMKVTVVLGSATFLLPHGAEVRPSGLSLLSASSVDVPEHDEEADLPMLDIEWTSILGRLRIMTEDEPEEEQDELATADAVAATPEAGRAERPPAPDIPGPPPGVGFEDLSEPAGVGFEDLSEPAEPAPEKSEPAGVGFEDLADPAGDSGSGADTDKEPETSPAGAGIGFEDL
jgi:hypothetical protein